MSKDCEHKWKVIKKFRLESKNLMGKENIDTCYHLQCSKCGDLKSRTVIGWEEK